MSSTINTNYFYEKRFRSFDGETYVKRYSRSYNIGIKKQKLQSSSILSQHALSTPEVDRCSSSNRSQSSSISRAQNKLKYLAFCNPDLQYFITLTNKDNLADENQALARFHQYQTKIRSLNLKIPFKFIAVKEFQKRGSIHWHMLCNFCPGLKQSPHDPTKYQCSLWDYGYSDVKKLQGDDNFKPELYLMKYFTKDSQKLFKQFYTCSRNLTRLDPRYIYDRLPIHPMAEHIFVMEKKLRDSVGFHLNKDTGNLDIYKTVDIFRLTEYYYNINIK